MCGSRASEPSSCSRLSAGRRAGGRQAASRWAAGPRDWLSLAGCGGRLSRLWLSLEAVACRQAVACRRAVAGRRSTVGRRAADQRATGRRGILWWLTAAPKPTVHHEAARARDLNRGLTELILRHKRDQRCRGGDKLAGGRSSSKTSPPVPLAGSWEAGGL